MAYERGSKGFDYLSSAEKSAAHSYKGYRQITMKKEESGKSQFTGPVPPPHTDSPAAASFKRKKRRSY